MTLHERHNGDVEVLMTLDIADDTLTIQVIDQHGSFTLHPKDGAQAMDMFNHPYAYADSVGLNIAYVETDAFIENLAGSS